MSPETARLYALTAPHRVTRSGRPAQIEKPGPGQESVWDYPRPPRLEASAKLVRVEFAGEKLAETTQALRVCETAGPPVYYLPPEDVAFDSLEPAAGRSVCEWKGPAQYWSARVGDRLAEQCGWSYPDPFPEYERLRDHIAFYPGRVACYLGRERVRPQPGEFYGGWISDEIVGPFKGEPGTEGW